MSQVKVSQKSNTKPSNAKVSGRKPSAPKSTVVEINNIAEFRTVAAAYGVKCPADRGRPPVVKLAKAIADKGHTIKPTAYFTGEAKTPQPRENSNAGKGVLSVSLSVPMVVKSTGDVKRKKDGGYQFLPQRQTVSLTVAEVRELTGAKASGRLSDARAVEAALIRKLGDKFSADMVAAVNGTVTREGKPSAQPADVPAAEKPSTARKASAKSQGTDDTVSESQTAAETVADEGTEEAA